MKDLEIVTKDKLESYLSISGVGNDLTKEERQNFLMIAQEFGLNPFKREIYCTSYGKGEYKKTSIIVGYEVYIKRAERTNLLDGWQVTTTGSAAKGDLKAILTIHRKDRKFPFTHEVDYSEYVQYTFDKQTNTQRPNKMWSEKPITMLKKVAMAQGFRLCFSDEVGGMPYDSAELPIEEKEVKNVIPQVATQEEKQIEEHQDNIIAEYFKSLDKKSKVEERVRLTLDWVESNDEISIKQAAKDKLVSFLDENYKAFYEEKNILHKYMSLLTMITGHVEES